MSSDRGLELRAFVINDRMQPQFAAFVGATIEGDPPLAGMSQLYVEVGPGNEVYRLADVILKASSVRPATLAVEREFGLLEVHASDPSAVQDASDAVQRHLGIDQNQRLKPKVASVQVITSVDPYQAQLINKRRSGALLVPGQTLLVLECTPAANIVLAANEAEKAADIQIVHCTNIGRFGRLLLAGSVANVQAARDAAAAALERLTGRDW